MLTKTTICKLFLYSGIFYKWYLFIINTVCYKTILYRCTLLTRHITSTISPCFRLPKWRDAASGGLGNGSNGAWWGTLVDWRQPIYLCLYIPSNKQKIHIFLSLMTLRKTTATERCINTAVEITSTLILFLRWNVYSYYSIIMI